MSEGWAGEHSLREFDFSCFSETFWGLFFKPNQIKSDIQNPKPRKTLILIQGGRGEDGESRRRAGRGTEEHSATCHVHDDAVFADRSVPTSISDAASEAFAPGVTQVTQESIDR